MIWWPNTLLYEVQKYVYTKIPFPVRMWKVFGEGNGEKVNWSLLVLLLLEHLVLDILQKRCFERIKQTYESVESDILCQLKLNHENT